MVEEDTELKDSVQRLHRYIVDALRTRRDDPFASPVSVSEIYQDLAPYRTVRQTLGFEMNADYEHALVRLLAGVDGLTRLDPPKARDRLRKELESPNPDVTLYRDYAGCDVVLNPPNPEADWVREQLDDETQNATAAREEAEASTSHTSNTSQPNKSAPDWSALADLSNPEIFEEEDETQDGEEQLQDATDDTWSDTTDAQASASPDVEVDAEGEAHANMAMTTPTPQKEESPHCSYCDSKLPASKNLRFCPYCGADQSTVPCATCGEALQPGWAFCIACGTAVA